MRQRTKRNLEPGTGLRHVLLLERYLCIGVPGKKLIPISIISAGLVVQLLADAPAGYVISANGSWSTGSGVLQAGQPVVAGARVLPQAPGSAITIAFLDGTAQTFRSGFTVEAIRPDTAPAASRILKAVGKRLEREKPIVHAMSRGGPGVEPAVLKLTGQKVDAAAALARLDAGDYDLEFRRGGSDSVHAKVAYDGEARAMASAPGLTPGLYTLHVSNTGSAATGLAPVLVAAEDRFEEKAADFEKGREMTRGWSRTIDVGAVQSFLSALLAELADE